MSQHEEVAQEVHDVYLIVLSSLLCHSFALPWPPCLSRTAPLVILCFRSKPVNKRNLCTEAWIWMTDQCGRACSAPLYLSKLHLHKVLMSLLCWLWQNKPVDKSSPWFLNSPMSHTHYVLNTLNSFPQQTASLSRVLCHRFPTQWFHH